METIHDRITRIIIHFADGKNTVLADLIGENEANIRGYRTSVVPKHPFLEKIVSNLDVSAEWLLTGKGSMIKSENMIGYAQRSLNGIPLIPVDAVAGIMSGNSAQVMPYECEYYDVPMFRGADFLIYVKGDSMVPKYLSGDIVACKRLSIDTFFQWNKVYVVDSEQGVIIKRVRPGDDDEHITMVSENTDYPPFTMRRRDIYSIALVMGLVRAE